MGKCLKNRYMHDKGIDLTMGPVEDSIANWESWKEKLLITILNQTKNYDENSDFELTILTGKYTKENTSTLQ